MKCTNSTKKLAALLLSGLLTAQLLPMGMVAKASPALPQQAPQSTAIPSFTPLYESKYGLKSEYEIIEPSLLYNSEFETESLDGWDIEGEAIVDSSGDLSGALTSPTCKLSGSSVISQTYALPNPLEQEVSYRFQILHTNSDLYAQDCEIQLEARDAYGDVVDSVSKQINFNNSLLSFVNFILPPMTETLTVRVVNASDGSTLEFTKALLFETDPLDRLNLMSCADFNYGLSFTSPSWTQSNIFQIKCVTQPGGRDPILDDTVYQFPAGLYSVYQTVPLDGKAGDRYDYALWAKSPGQSGDYSYMSIEIPTVDGTGWEEISRYDFSIAAVDWQYGTKKFTLPRDCSSLRMKYYHYGKTAPAWVDGAQVFKEKPVVPPTPLPLNLQNSGFENGMSGWINRGNTCAYLTQAQRRSGLYSAYFSYFSSQPMNNFLEQTYISNRGGAYTFSVYVKTDSAMTGTGAQLVLEAKDAAGSPIANAASTAIATTGGSWQKLRVTLNAPAATKSVTVKIGGVSCTGGFYADDAALSLL